MYAKFGVVTNKNIYNFQVKYFYLLKIVNMATMRTFKLRSDDFLEFLITMTLTFDRGARLDHAAAAPVRPSSSPKLSTEVQAREELFNLIAASAETLFSCKMDAGEIYVKDRSFYNVQGVARPLTQSVSQNRHTVN